MPEQRSPASRLSAVALVLLTGAAVVFGYWCWHTLHRPFQGYSGAEILVDLPRGTDARRILEGLEADGVLANAMLTRLYLVYWLGDPPLIAGEYRFTGPLSALEILEQLTRGQVETHPVTVIEGLTLAETSQRLSQENFGDPERFLSIMGSPALISDLDPEATDLEGYLFPDTYHFARGLAEEEIVGAMVATFRRHWTREIRPLAAASTNRGLRELVTLASIIEKEARLDEERPIIAGVYANRLRQGMLLQADPTVIFALKLLDRWSGNLRRKDLELDSPYNTYVYPGLPPGPIASPGLATLKAAARPAEVPYLYFVSRNDGSHVFAKTLAEHNRNVYQWQKLYWRRRWAEERRQSTAKN